jgi:hypothetical protein
VWIQFDDAGAIPHVRLNREALPVHCPDETTAVVEITERMRPHNVLSVELAFDTRSEPGRPRGLWQPVLLRIEEPEPGAA